MGGENGKKRWPLILLVIAALAALAFFAGAPLLEKRIAARFEAETRAMAEKIQPGIKVGYERVEASLLRRSVTYYGVTLDYPESEYGFNITEKKEKDMDEGYDFGSFFGFYPEVSTVSRNVGSNVEVWLNGSKIYSADEVVMQDLRYSHKKMLEYVPREQGKPLEDGEQQKEETKRLLGLYKDISAARVTLKNSSLSYLAAVLRIPYMEINDISFKDGIGEISADNIDLLVMGQPLFTLASFRQEALRWGGLLEIGRMVMEGKPEDIKPETMAGVLEKNPVTIRGVKYSDLKIYGFPMLTGSGGELLSLKELTGGFSLGKGVTFEAGVSGLTPSDDLLGMLPETETLARLHGKPFSLAFALSGDISDFTTQPCDFRLKMSAREDSLGGASADLDGVFEQNASLTGGEVYWRAIKAVVTDSGFLDLAWRYEDQVRPVEGGAKAAALADMKNRLSGKNDAALKAIMDFAEQGGSLNVSFESREKPMSAQELKRLPVNEVLKVTHSAP